MRISLGIIVSILSFAVSLTFASNLQAFCYEEAGEIYGINPGLLMAISKTESNLNPLAININLNGTRDFGLMQINSSWITPLGLNSGLLLSDPCYNLKAGAGILRKCIDRYKYTWEAIGCYNATSSQKRVKYSWMIFDRLKTQDRSRKLEAEKLETLNSEFHFVVSEIMP
jgi:soluble lytic murein transglycosylase-like protein